VGGRGLTNERSAAMDGERGEEEIVQANLGDQWGSFQVPPGSTPSEASAPADGDRGSASLLRSIASDISLLVSKQVELAKQEIGEMVGTRAKAVGVFGAAAVLGLFVIGFLGMAGAEGLAVVLPRWAAMLIVAGGFALLAGLAIVLARRWLRSSASKPELTQESLKEDVAWARQQLRR
jgi:putative superfamily III holin-X